MNKKKSLPYKSIKFGDRLLQYIYNQTTLVTVSIKNTDANLIING